MERLTHRPAAQPRAGSLLAVVAVFAVLAVAAACGSSPPAARPPTAAPVTTPAPTTPAPTTTTATSTAATGFERLEPGPVTVPECAGGRASARVAITSGRLRQVDLSDAHVCLEDDGQARMVMPLPVLPLADSPAFVIDVRDDDGGLFLFALPEGFPRPGGVRTADRHPVVAVTSPSGRVLAIFDPQALQGPVVARFELLGGDREVLATVDAAVARNGTTPGGPAPTLPADDAAVPAAIAASLLRDPGPPYLGVIVTSDEAACIGDGLVGALGLPRVRTLGVGAIAWPSLATGVGMTPDEASRVVDVLQSCAAHWKRFAFLYATEGTGEMSEMSAQCVEREITDDEARTFFVKERSGYRTVDHILPVEAAVDRCVTPDERERIDWN